MAFYEGQLQRGALSLPTGHKWSSGHVAQKHGNAPLPRAEQPCNLEDIQPRSVPPSLPCVFPEHGELCCWACLQLPESEHLGTCSQPKSQWDPKSRQSGV